MKHYNLIIISLIGAISTISGEILTQIMKYFGFAKYSNYGLASLLITFNRPVILIGIIIDGLMGGVVAILMYFLLRKFGSDYLIIQTTTGGLIAWLITELLFTTSVEGTFIDLRSISGYYVHILGAAAFGVTLGFLFKRFIFKKSSS